MYGLVNKAIEELISKEHGRDTWETIRQKAKVDDVMFVGMKAYDDAVTYRLVGAASEHLCVPSDVLLRSFGQYWTVYIAEQGYRELIEMFGGNLREFVSNLDAMHARVALMFPELKPPSFRIEDTDDETIRVHYYTERPGLAAMVIGLLEGLGMRFNTPVQVEHALVKGEDQDHDVFEIHYRHP